MRRITHLPNYLPTILHTPDDGGRIILLKRNQIETSSRRNDVLARLVLELRII